MRNYHMLNHRFKGFIIPLPDPVIFRNPPKRNFLMLLEAISNEKWVSILSFLYSFTISFQWGILGLVSFSLEPRTLYTCKKAVWDNLAISASKKLAVFITYFILIQLGHFKTVLIKP